MKCVKIKNKKLLEVSETPLPSANENTVIFKVLACGICGSDLHNYESGEPNGLIMGHEFCGLVIDSGNRKDLKAGDRITGLPISPCGECEACKTGNYQYCKDTWNNAVGLSLTNPGGYANYCSCRSDMVIALPKNVSDNAGAMVEPAAVSLHAINLANIKIGEAVLIVGGGIIGLLAAEFAKLNGASYVALIETNDYRGQKACSFGYVNDYFDAKDKNLINLVNKKIPNGFDKVIECCGNEYAVTESIMLVKNGGKIVLVGVNSKPINIPTVLTVMKEVTMQGAIAYTKEEFSKVIELISAKKIDVEKYITKIIGLDEVNEICADLTSGNTKEIKVIIKP